MTMRFAGAKWKCSSVLQRLPDNYRAASTPRCPASAARPLQLLAVIGPLRKERAHPEDAGRVRRQRPREVIVPILIDCFTVR